MSVIVVDDLHKSYGDVHAVAGLSFTVAEGEVYGLLGHNGAGKSTTVEILEGHRRATSGSVSVLGIDAGTGSRELRDRVGVVLQSSGVEPALTVAEALRFYGSCYRSRRSIDEVLDMIDLGSKRDDRIGTLSGGQRRRLDLGLGIVGQPEVLFLDEPTTGFDPVARRQSWQLVQRLSAGGTTVLLTTHYLDEAEHLADRVGVLVDGRLVAEGTPDELMAAAPEATIAFDLPPGLGADELGVPGDAIVEGGRVTIATETPTTVLATITAVAVERGVELGSLSVRRPSLEEVFLRIGREMTPEDSVVTEADVAGASAGRWPSAPPMVLEQTRYQVLTMLRSPVGMFFTIVLPTIMLVLFNALFGDGTIRTPRGEWSVRQFYTGGLAAFTAVSATYTNLVNVIPIRRDEGILKRWRSTPIPPWVYLAGWVLGALVIAVLGTGLQLVIGVVFYDLELDPAKMPALVVTFVIGVAVFAALGLAVAGLVPNADSAPAVANATILPLAFISDVFIAQDDPPRWLEVVGGIFPLKPFANTFQDTINPLVDAPAFGWSQLAVIVAWGLGGAVVARSTFTWEPATRGRSRSRRRRRPGAQASA